MPGNLPGPLRAPPVGFVDLFVNPHGGGHAGAVFAPLRPRGRRHVILPGRQAVWHVRGPVVVQVLEGEDAIRKNREVMGATNPADAAAGTIRADFANSLEENAVHGSDGPDTARDEIGFFFGEDEICARTR